MKSKLLAATLATAGFLGLSGCDYDAPVTAGPTRAVDEHLLGDWVTFDKEDNKTEQMSVRKFDDFTYVVSIDSDIYRAFHSDYAKLPLLSVQDLNSSSRKFIIYAWRLSADNAQLTLQRVTTQVIPDTAKDSIALQHLLTENAANPKLLADDLVFTRKKPAH